MTRKRIYWIAGVLILLLVVSVTLVLVRQRKAPASNPKAAAVVGVVRGSLANSLTIAGQFQPYQEVDLHAKVSGYIRWIKVDIGDRVRQGEVLAELEVPELQDQLQGAQAEVRHTQSEIERAQSEVVSAASTHAALHAAYTRLLEASKERPGLIAEQELDDAHAKDQESEAQIGVAKASFDAMQQQLGVSQADSHRIQTLTHYEQIISPFNGVVTMRYADTGSLIQSGTSSNTQSMPVVRVAQSDLLRLRMPVPESDVPYIREGGDVRVKVNATGKVFGGKIVRFARSLDSDTRTMLTEVDVPNADLSLSPGMYAESIIQLQQRSDAVFVPAQAVVQSGEHAYVLVVDDSHRIEKRAVVLGIQTANRIEIANGLRVGEQVIASGQANYQPGETVTPHAAFIPTVAEEESE
jgi:RND family efflux transporter MFP subunit